MQPSDPPPLRRQIAELVAVEEAALLVEVEVLDAEVELEDVDELLELEETVPGTHCE